MVHLSIMLYTYLTPLTLQTNIGYIGPTYRIYFCESNSTTNCRSYIMYRHTMRIPHIWLGGFELTDSQTTNLLEKTSLPPLCIVYRATEIVKPASIEANIGHILRIHKNLISWYLHACTGLSL